MEEEKPKMIELSIRMSDTMNYNINIPSLITPQTFPEIIKRMKSVISIIPKEELLIKRTAISPIMILDIEESKDVFKLYKTYTRGEFIRYILDNYNIRTEKWENLVSLMGRLKARITTLEKNKKSEVKSE